MASAIISGLSYAGSILGGTGAAAGAGAAGAAGAGATSTIAGLGAAGAAGTALAAPVTVGTLAPVAAGGAAGGATLGSTILSSAALGAASAGIGKLLTPKVPGAGPQPAMPTIDALSRARARRKVAESAAAQSGRASTILSNKLGGATPITRTTPAGNTILSDRLGG